MHDAKKLNQILAFRPRILKIREQTSFGQILAKIKKSKNPDFVFVQKAKPSQMLAILLTRLAGKKFFWMQNLTNPPSPDFPTRLLLAQADRILVNSRQLANKLIALGVNRTKIKVRR